MATGDESLPGQAEEYGTLLNRLIREHTADIDHYLDRLRHEMRKFS